MTDDTMTITGPDVGTQPHHRAADAQAGKLLAQTQVLEREREGRLVAVVARLWHDLFSRSPRMWDAAGPAERHAYIVQVREVLEGTATSVDARLAVLLAGLREVVR